MAFSKLDIKNEIILSLPAGGQIQTALLDQRIDFCMKKIFAETEILKLTRYINEVKDQQFYRIGESQTSETNHPGDIETINVCRLSRVKHKDGTTNYDISTVDERTVIPKSQYSFVSAVEDSSREMKLYLHNKSSETKTAGIELLFSASTASTTYVDPLFIQDFRDALLAGAEAKIEIIDYEEGMTASSTEDNDTNQFQNIGGGVFCYKCSKSIKTKII